MLNKDALAARLRATFLGELDDQVRVLNADLLALESSPRDGERLRSVFRVVHTLKGAARAAGIPLVEAVCHELEAGLMSVRDGKGVLHEADFTRLFAAADALTDAGRRLQAGEDLSSSPLADLAAMLLRGQGPVPIQSAPPEVKLPERASAAAPAPVSAPATAVEPPGPMGPAVVGGAGATAPATIPAVGGAAERGVRVTAARLDALWAATSELTVVDSRFAGRADEIEALRMLAATWTTDWRRARAKLRRVLAQAEMADVTRSFGWVDDNLRRLAQETERLAAHLADDARALTHVTGRITDGVRHARLRPFTEACEALPRIVRDVARVAQKEVALVVDGREVQADREVLDAVRDALLHLVRNAVDHGIEAPADRERLGKPKAGTVRVSAVVRGDRLVVAVSDDGRGLDTATIRARLRERGSSDTTDPAMLGRLLLQGGLSTRSEAGPISGRGVGLDAVRDAIERVRGSLEVEWAAEQGTTFTLTCPPSLATVRVLLVTAGGPILALPCADIERVDRIHPDAVKRAAGRDVIMTPAGDAVPLAPLARVIGAAAPPQSDSQASGEHIIVVTLAAAGRRVGLIVDRAVEEREIVLRPLRTGRRPLPLVSGAAPLGTGRVALLLNSTTVVSAGLDWSPAGAPQPAVPDQRRYCIMVVDDSLTTRALEQNLLEAAGYDVITAVDGAQAWDLLQTQSCDLVVTDVEMPRMDGFALCQTIRGSRRYERLPVVLVTALDAPEHRARGLEAGADAYLVKSAFDRQALLATIQRLLG